MAGTGEVEKAILGDLARRGPCSIEEMVTHLPGYTWNQVFSAVDRLSRDGKVTLQHPSRFGYHISLGQDHRPNVCTTGDVAHSTAGALNRNVTCPSYDSAGLARAM
jgi:hypothetical protein